MALEQIPLISLSEGEVATVHSVSGSAGLIGRLAAMGIAPGSKLKIIRKSRGPVVVLVHGTRVAIGHGQASKIMVIKNQIQDREGADTR